LQEQDLVAGVQVDREDAPGRMPVGERGVDAAARLPGATICTIASSSPLAASARWRPSG